MPHTLYGVPGSRSKRVAWMIYELGLDFDGKANSFQFEAIKLPAQPGDEILKHNPLGRSPTFVPERATRAMTESGAIIQFILQMFDSDRKFQPNVNYIQGKNLVNPKEAADYFHFFFHPIGGGLDDDVVAGALNTFVLPEPLRDKALLAEKHEHFKTKVLPLYSNLFKDGREYVIGKKFTGADIMVGYTMDVASKLGWLAGETNLLEFVKRVTSRPAFIKAGALPQEGSLPPKKVDQVVPSLPKKPHHLYGAGPSRSRRAVWAIFELGLEFDGKPNSFSYEAFDLPAKPGHKILTHNPLGRAPTLVLGDDHGTTITESGAIIEWLLACYDPDKKLQAPIKDGDALAIADFFHFLVHPVGSGLDDACVQGALNSYIFPPAMRKSDAVVKAKALFDKLLPVYIDLFKDGREYSCGAKFTAPDLMVGYTLTLVAPMGWLDAAPTLKAYHQRITARPAWVKSGKMPPNGTVPPSS